MYGFIYFGVLAGEDKESQVKNIRDLPLALSAITSQSERSAILKEEPERCARCTLPRSFTIRSCISYQTTTPSPMQLSEHMSCSNHELNTSI